MVIGQARKLSNSNLKSGTYYGAGQMTRLASKRFFSLALLLCLFPRVAYANEKHDTRLQAGECIENFPLLGDISQEDRSYLGLGEQGPTLCDIPRTVIWIQVFSIYCPQCQAMVPTFNDLYKLTQENCVSRKNVKMVGIGAGNNDYEVKYYQKFYKVLFPLLPDPAFTIHKILHEPRTPFVFLAKVESKKTMVLEIVDPTKPPKRQFEQLMATLERTLYVSHGEGSPTDDLMQIGHDRHLWNDPNGRIIGGLLKGSNVRIIVRAENWCKIETLGNDGNIQGWLPIK